MTARERAVMNRLRPLAERQALWLEIVSLRDADVSLSAMGRAMGLSTPRVHQLLQKGLALKASMGKRKRRTA